MGIWNWDELRDSIIKNGVRNSLLVAPMPTASTSQILGNNECFEPYTANMYTRRVLAGEFTVINKHLIKDLQNCDLWDTKMKDQLIRDRGSIMKLPIPLFFKSLYKTAFELKQKVLVDMARDRAFYICQSQSLNLFFEHPDFETLSKAHLYSWKSGLKTGSYYIRSKPAITSQQFTVSVNQSMGDQLGNNQNTSSNEPCELCSS
jgi:ribonucleoside-diphosphate reductase alpha chain